MMRLESLELRNFGPFKNEHRIDLSVPDASRPIIVIGGLNGAGKTSILDAIHLALYGKHASLAKYGDGGYQSYLKSAVHRDVGLEEGASVALTLSHGPEQHAVTYRVERSWAAPPGKRQIREQIRVWRDGRELSDVEQYWDLTVETILPRSIAPLFFFDGEKIEQLADLERAQARIEAGILALLGIDVVDQLSSDLAELSLRLARRDLEKEKKAQLEEFAGKVAYLRREKNAAEAELAQLRAAQQTLEDRLERLEVKFQDRGGPLFEARAELQRQLEETQERLDRLRNETVNLLSGALPLIQVRPLLERIQQKQTEFRRAERVRLVRSEIRELGKEVLDLLQSKQVAGEIVEAVERRFKPFMDAETKNITGWVLDERASRQLDALLEELLAQEHERWLRIQEERERLETQLDHLRERLSKVPDEEDIASLVNKIQEVREEILRGEGRIAEVQSRLDELSRQLDAETRVLERKQLELFEVSEARRIQEHLGRARRNLARFRERVLARHVERIEANITHSFRTLARKQRLIDRIRINVDTLEPVLLDSQGRTISPDDLSAGERQMLATAILWGLAQSSRKSLPAIIDTPLGRLDSRHRNRLIQEYFPHASHQVILLSTDEEITLTQFEKLRSAMARAYRIVHDEREAASRIEPGYFWEVAA